MAIIDESPNNHDLKLMKFMATARLTKESILADEEGKSEFEKHWRWSAEIVELLFSKAEDYDLDFTPMGLAGIFG